MFFQLLLANILNKIQNLQKFWKLVKHTILLNIGPAPKHHQLKDHIIFNFLRGIGLTSSFSANFYIGENFCDFLFAFSINSSESEVYSKRKEYAPIGSKFFPLRVDPSVAILSF